MNTASAIHIDFSDERTIDATGEFFRAVEAFGDDDDGFQRTVPPHLSEDAVAHWDADPLW